MTGTSDAAELRAAPKSLFRLPVDRLGILTHDEREQALGHVRALLEPATAPYNEDAQVDVIRRFVAQREGFTLEEDAHANLIVTWRGSANEQSAKRASDQRTTQTSDQRVKPTSDQRAERAGAARGKRARAPSEKQAKRGTRDLDSDVPQRVHGLKLAGPRVLAFSAHLDHPGFIYAGRKGGEHRAVFHGGVPVRYFKGAHVRFFDMTTREACATATIADVEHEGLENPRASFTDFRGSARREMFGMWDLTAGALRGSRLFARVCDDLMGAASILSLLDLVARARHPREVVGIFTRAEETGFVGCQGLLREGILPANLAVIGLECSPKRATAKVGLGPVIRVGDKQSVFQPWITHHLQEAAATLRARHERFPFQRALMDGGSCESTAYNLWDVPAGALCLALGNYHNCGAKNQIAPEYVDWNDFEGLIALMLEATRSWETARASDSMRSRLDRIWERERERLEVSSRRIRSATLESIEH